MHAAVAFGRVGDAPSTCLAGYWHGRGDGVEKRLSALAAESGTSRIVPVFRPTHSSYGHRAHMPATPEKRLLINFYDLYSPYVE